MNFEQSNATAGQCQGCETPLPPKTWKGPDRKWCSDRCRKLTLYAKRCVDCGKTINTDGSVTDASVRCNRCHGLHKTRWTRETVIDAMKRWAVEYGGPPMANEWNATLSSGRGDSRYEQGDWPSLDTVQRVFGSWSTGIEAAGFDPLPVGVRREFRRAA